MFTTKTKIAMMKAVLTKKSPFYIQFYISKYCNLNCRMCNIVDANKHFTPFDGKYIEQIADNLVKIGAGVILLTGGEPFLRKDIDEIVRIFKAKKLDVRLQTAGLISLKEKIKKCADNGARDISISIDSLDEELSDYINGVKGSWRNAIKTIAFISRTFPRRDTICALGCVISNYNIDEIEPIIEFATEIGWWVSLVPVHITTKDKPMKFRGYDIRFKIKPEEYEKLKNLIARLKRMKKIGYHLFDSNDYLDSIYHFVTTGRPSWRYKNICDTPNLYFAIMPDGSFAPCCDFELKKKIYLYDPDFPKIYKSKQFHSDIKAIAKKCPGCNFGSFPEMTLSARSFRTMRERLFLQIKARQKMKYLTEDEIFNIIERIKKKYPVYQKKRLQKKWYKKTVKKFVM